MNVLLLLRDLAYTGGVPQSLLTLAKSCDSRRLRLWVGTFRQCQPEMVAAFERVGTPVHKMSDGGYLRPAQAVRQLILEHRIDAVVCASFKTYLIAKAAAFGSRHRVLFWIASVPEVIKGPLRRTLFRQLARHDALIFISRAVQRAHAYAGHRGPQQVIYYGITDPLEHPELQPYPKEARAQLLGLPPDAFVMGFVAEFIAWKDHATLITAFAKVAETTPRAWLLLIGTGAGRAQTEALARLMPCHDRIRFLGPRHDARRLLGLLDAYVHPSRGEGLGLAVVESMLAEVPVIVSDEGAFPEYVEDRRTGLLVGGGDADGLARAIGELMACPDFSRDLASSGRAACLERFSTTRFANEMTTLIEQVVACRTSAPLPQGDIHDTGTGT